LTEVLILAAALGFQLLDTAPNGDPLFEGPVAVRCHSNGNIYVTDDIGHRVLVFDRAGRVQKRLGSYGAAPGQLLSPDAVHWDNERLYVADAGANRIQAWTDDGHHLHDIGRHPSWRRALGPGLALSAAVLLSAFVVVALVPAWRQTGLALPLLLAGIAVGSAAAFVIYGTFGGLRNPRDVLVGPDGLVYVADFNGHAVRVSRETANWCER
jgi:DNA-binding beta-propeller fold protein YncE